MTHVAILFVDCGDFDPCDWRIKSPISGMSDIGNFIHRTCQLTKIIIATASTPGNFFTDCSNQCIKSPGVSPA